MATTDADKTTNRVYAIASRVHDLVDSGGFSVDSDGNPAPEHGYYVGGVVKELVTRTVTVSMIAEFMLRHWSLLTARPKSHEGQYFLGGWRNSDTGLFHLDCSEYFGVIDDAKYYGFTRGEIAIWDAFNEIEIRL